MTSRQKNVVYADFGRPAGAVALIEMADDPVVLEPPPWRPASRLDRVCNAAILAIIALPFVLALISLLKRAIPI